MPILASLDPDQWSVLLDRIIRANPERQSEQIIGDLQVLGGGLIELLGRTRSSVFLDHFMPWALELLRTIPPSLDPRSSAHCLRLAVLRCLSKTPVLEEAFRASAGGSAPSTSASTGRHLDGLCAVLIDVLRADNEECALVALHTIIDIQKAFRHLVESMVPPFLDFVIGLLDCFDRAVAEQVQIARQQQSQSRQQPGSSGNVTLRPATQSIRILLECPVIVVLVFQLHRRFINDYIGRFVPVVMKALQAQSEPPGPADLYPQPTSLDEAAETVALLAATTGSSTEALTGQALSVRTVFCDYIAARVKVLSFFAYISRGFIGAVRGMAVDIPPVVLGLLKDCPADLPSARKELLVAIRHILSTELRSAFLPFLGTLLEERLLLGDGWTGHVFFRPLAYSLLADLVHHVRLELPPKHLCTVVSLYCRLLADVSLPVGIHAMSAKLLLNLVDPIVGERMERPLRRVLLQKIMAALLFKVSSLAKLVSACPELATGASTASGSEEDSGLTNARFLSPFFDAPGWEQAGSTEIGPLSILAVVIGADGSATDSWRDGAREYRYLLKTLLSSLKTVILSLKQTQQSAASPAQPQSQPQSQQTVGQEPADSAIGLSLAEAQAFVVFFADGLVCLRLLASSNSSRLEPNHIRSFSVSAVPAEEKELLDQFSYIFTLLELPHFFDVVERSLPVLMLAVQYNAALLAVPQYFLAITGLSKNFASILARFLVDRLAVLGEAGETEAAVLLRLFKLLFLSVSVYPEENETVLQPHVADIIMQCLRGRARAAAGSLAPHHYFYLLRSLFRSIGGGRFEALYKEVLPLISVILEELNRLIFDRDVFDDSTVSSPVLQVQQQQHREVLVELCLTVPVRLSVLLPYLPLLMRPLVIALGSTGELIGQGLRTLELCIDNLTQDFLEPVLAPIFDDLQRALWRLLQPSPTVNASHAQAAMRILGKLGGRSRRLSRSLFLTPPPDPQPAAPGCSITLPVCSGTVSLAGAGSPRSRFPATIDVTIDCAIESAARILTDPLGSANRSFSGYAFSIVRHFLLCSIAAVPPSDSSPTHSPPSSSSSPSTPSTSATAYLDTTRSPEEAVAHRLLVRTCLVALFRCYDSLVSVGRSDPAIPASPLPITQAEVERLLETVYVHCLRLISGLEGMRPGMAVVEDAKMFVEVLIVAACLVPSASAAVVPGDTSSSAPATSNPAASALVMRFIEQGVLLPLARSGLSLSASVVMAPGSVAQLFFDRLFSYCYESPKSARPGLTLLLDRLCTFDSDGEPAWIVPISTRLLRALLFLLKDASWSPVLLPSPGKAKSALAAGGAEQAILERTSQSVFRLIKACVAMATPPTSPQDQPTQLQLNLQTGLVQLVTVLVAELSCPNAVVRDAVQTGFQLIAESRGVEVAELLGPFRDRLLPPIFTKPLRALPFSMQIGHIDAVTYCLTVRRNSAPHSSASPVAATFLFSPASSPPPQLVSIPLVQWSDELLRMLQEVLALAETDDHNLLGKAGQLRNTQVLVGLRVVCIRFLAACLPLPELQVAKQAHLRNHIVSVFFKSLYSRSPEVVEVARHGLELVVANQSKLPKDLLQLGLRPVLMNLAEAKRLTLAGLEGLSRVLQLLTSYFKAEIGRKLLDHLAVWAEPAVLEASRTRLLADVPELCLITAILAVFPLLPSSANIFLAELVRLVADLEVAVLRRASSPFRPALFAFLAKYPIDAAECLVENIQNPVILSLYSDFFLSNCAGSTPRNLPTIVGSTSCSTISAISSAFPEEASLSGCGAVAREIAQRINRIVPAIIQPNLQPSIRLEYQRLLLGIARQPGRLLSGARIFRDLIGTLWSNIDMLSRKGDASLILSEEEIDLLMQVSREYILANPGDTEFVFSWLALLRPPLPADLCMLPRFLSTSWLPLCSGGELAKSLKLWLSFCYNPDVPVLSKALVTRLVALPVLRLSAPSIASSQAGPLDGPLLSALKQQLWSRDGRNPITHPSLLTFIELQFTSSLLAASVPTSSPAVPLSCAFVQRFQKELCEFALNRSACQDPLIRVSSVALSHAINGLAGESTNPTTMGLVCRALLQGATLETRTVIKGLLLGVLIGGTGDRATGKTSSLSPAISAAAAAITGFLDGDQQIGVPAILALWQAILEREDCLLGKALPSSMASIPPNLPLALLLSVGRYGASAMAVPDCKSLCPRMAASAAKAILGCVTEVDQKTAVIEVIHSVFLSVLRWSSSIMDSSNDSGQARQAVLDLIRSVIGSGKIPLGRLFDGVDLSGLDRAIASTGQMTTTPAGTAGGSGVHQPSGTPSAGATGGPAAWPEDEVRIIVHFGCGLLKPLLDVSQERETESILLSLLSTVPRLLDSILAAPLSDPLASGMARALIPLAYAHQTKFPLFKSRIDALLADCMQSGRICASLPLILVEEFAMTQTSSSPLPFSTTSVSSDQSQLPISSSSGQSVDALVNALYRLLQRVAKDLQPVPTDPSATAERTFIDLLQIALERSRSEDFGHLRSGLQATMAMVWGRPGLSHCHRTILNMIKAGLWTTPVSLDNPVLEQSCQQSSSFQLSPKECVELVKIADGIISSSDSALLREYHELLAAIYSHPALRATEGPSSLQLSFLSGLLERDAAVRGHLTELLLNSLSPSLGNLFCQLMVGLEWPRVGARFWLRSIVSLLFSYFARMATPKTDMEDISNAGTGYANTATVSLRSRVLFDPRVPAQPPLPPTPIASLAAASDCCQESFLSALASLAHFDDSLARSLFISILPEVWSLLPVQQRAEFDTELVTVMSRSELLSQRFMRPNVPETFLEACTRIRSPISPPRLTPQLLRYLAQHFCGWYAGACLLERLTMASASDQEILAEESMVTGVKGGALVPGSSSGNYSAASGSLTAAVVEKAQFALSSLLERLGEDDMWYGVMRRRAVFPETVVSLSLGQAGQWASAQTAIEATLNRARNGVIGYLGSEYCLWEREWFRSARALQQWDLIGEVAKVDGDPEGQLESLWHVSDWSSPDTQYSVQSLLQAPPPASQPSPVSLMNLPRAAEVRKLCFEGLVLLEQARESPDRLSRFHVVVEEAMSAAIRDWWSLPGRPTGGHSAVLESFQSIVELQEAQLIFANQHQLPHFQHPSGPVPNRGSFLQELKGLLGTWRDRLPNLHDRIGSWSDMLAWRQHVYSALSAAFQSYLPPPDPSGFASGTTQQSQGQQPSQAQPQPLPNNPLAFRGYHETAWLINRFAKMCRKNNLLDVCLSTLNRIYTLPNIEIQDAFLKLREQTKCYMQEAVDLPLALEVVNATNLNYFNAPQKAEFFALKAVIYMRLGMLDEANRILAQAVQIDLNLPKGWAVWAGYNDLRFQQSTDRTYAVNAINCFLQAASLHKSGRCRKFLARVLWLSTFEDDAGSVLKPFELYASELPVWYWIFFVPQLILALNRKEYRQARYLLIKIAKSFPQALYMTLRAANEDFRLGLGSPSQTRASSGAASVAADVGLGSPPPQTAPIQTKTDDSLYQTQQQTSQSSQPQQHPAPNPSHLSPSHPTPVPSPVLTTGNGQLPSQSTQPLSPVLQEPQPRRSAAEESEEIMAVLKTAYPLLTLSIENLVDHLVNRLRASPDEDLLRILTTLHAEASQQLALSIGASGSDDLTSPFRAAVDLSLRRVSEMINSFTYLQQRYKPEFDADFITSAPTLPEIVKNLRRWKTRLEDVVSCLPSSISVDTLSRYLSEFEHQKYDDVEIPGQYLTLVDGHVDFIRIARLHPTVKILKRHGTSYRRIVFVGHDGSRHGFLIQNPVARNGRREERLLQFFRLLNGPMARKIPTKRRGLEFAVPFIIPISSHARLVKDDADTTSLEEVLQRHIRSKSLEDPVRLYLDTLLSFGRSDSSFKRGSSDFMNLRLELNAKISRELCPDDILLKFMVSAFPNAADFWLMRRHYSQQFALATFMCYVMCFGHRTPAKFIFSHSNVSISVNEVLPSINNSGQIALLDAVPFRFTPNIQRFIGSIGIEGIFAESIRVIASIFSQVEKGDMGLSLPLFLRDELASWLLSNMESLSGSQLEKEAMFFNGIASYDHDFCSSKIKPNIELFNKRVLTLACVREAELATSGAPERVVTANQAILDLISCATNPQKISLMDPIWHPWF